MLNTIVTVATFALCLAGEAGESGRSIAPRILTDIDGCVHQPFADPKTKAIVLVFISPQCPIANGYQPLLQRCVSKYRDEGVHFFMIHPSARITMEAASQHRTDFKIECPVVIDSTQKITRSVRATITPEVFVFTRKNSAPVYQGRIDNLYAGYGKKRRQATQHDLVNAIESLISNKPIELTRTKAIGCFIALE